MWLNNLTYEERSLIKTYVSSQYLQQQTITKNISQILLKFFFVIIESYTFRLHNPAVEKQHNKTGTTCNAMTFFLPSFLVTKIFSQDNNSAARLN